MAVDWRHAPPVRRAIAYGRLPLQLPLVLWGLRIARAAPGATGTLGTLGATGTLGSSGVRATGDGVVSPRV
jgi:hypothetical protein